jgi:peptidoglycan/xylan/chitin deacetylase (PgdA/CDA1 family)
MNLILPITTVAVGLLVLAGLYFYEWGRPTSRIFAPAIVRGPAMGKKIALTFDDGPAQPFTEQILDILLTQKVKATFFVCGKNVERYPNIALHIKAEGHSVGNHTYSHPFLYLRSRRFMADEIDRTQEVLWKVTGERSAIFRPPYGARWPGLVPVLRERGLQLVNWSDTGYDWKYNSEEIVRSTLKRLKPGAIILLHDGLEVPRPRPVDQSATVQALPAIIDSASEAGFSFVTVSELLSENVNVKEPDSVWKATDSH